MNWKMYHKMNNTELKIGDLVKYIGIHPPFYGEIIDFKNKDIIYQTCVVVDATIDLYNFQKYLKKRFMVDYESISNNFNIPFINTITLNIKYFILTNDFLPDIILF